MLELRSFPCRLIVLVLCVLTFALVTAPSLVHAAAGESMPALALTDHGTMFGAIEFYSKAKEMGLYEIK